MSKIKGFTALSENGRYQLWYLPVFDEKVGEKKPSGQQARSFNPIVLKQREMDKLYTEMKHEARPEGR